MHPMIVDHGQSITQPWLLEWPTLPFSITVKLLFSTFKQPSDHKIENLKIFFLLIYLKLLLVVKHTGR